MTDITQTAQILKIPGMTTEEQRDRVKAALEAVPGVVAVAVDLKAARATVIMRADGHKRGLVEALASAGFPAA